MRIAIAVLLFAGTLSAQTAWGIDPDKFGALEWREVGPYRGGRAAAVTGVQHDRDLYYFGSTGGGVWKTSDGGHRWSNISDGFFGGSVGAVTVAESDPNVIYVGLGEKTVRGNVSHGDGVWRSTDAGRTWKFVGLGDSRHVPRIRVHPRDENLVYAAVLGHLHGPNDQRGIFRSKDGGDGWERVLFVDENTGAVDLAMDPTNPRILYAAFWQVRRTPWSLESGGPSSSLWKSTDSGDTWTRISDAEGFPDGPLGIMGISVSRSDPDSLYAIVEAKEGGVFRSRDAGKTWQRTNQDRSLRQRAWYYSRIYADPVDSETVYVLNVGMHRSTDGGREFRSLGTPHGDNHDLWIDPADPRRMIESNDGGANISYDGGEHWTDQDGQPTAQMYRVSTDNAFPYRLLGGQQDNSAIRIRSRSLTSGSIGERDWEPTAGGESGHIVAKPDDPDIVVGGSYGGYLVVLDHRTGDRRNIHPWPDNPMGWGAAELRYRFQWNFPIFFSPHDPDRLYVAAQVLLRSDDLGASWTEISPDLTTNDKAKQGSSGGPITQDNTSVEYYCTIFAAIESPLEPGVLWCGSDDGRVHVTRDAGVSWIDVTPTDLPPGTLINCLDAHPREKGGLYLAATGYKRDDFHPYLYRTRDYGAHWTRIDAGIPEDHFTRAIRSDTEREGLLFAGTERGVYFSLDDGESWASLQLSLPVTPITDLAVKEGDLIAATQGRGYWILDDLEVLRQWRPELASGGAHLFTPRPTARVFSGRWGRGNGGTNPPSGVVIRYYLPADLAPEEKLELSFRDAAGEVIRTFRRKGAAGTAAGDAPAVLEATAGLQQFVWNTRYPDAEEFPGMVLWNGGVSGPRALPGRYQAELTAGATAMKVAFEITPNPLSGTTAEELRAQFDFLIAARDKLTATHRQLGRLRDLRTELARVQRNLGESHAEYRAALDALVSRIEPIEQALYQTRNQSSQDPLNFPIRLNDKLSGLAGSVATGDHPPTAQSRAVWRTLIPLIDAELERSRVIFEVEVPALNERARALGVPTIFVGKAKEVML